MPADETRSITVDGVELTVELTRKRVRHVNARLRGDVLRVSAPLRLAEESLSGAIVLLARRLLRRRRAATITGASRIDDLARSVAARFPDPPAVRSVAFVATQRARWGSYSPATGAVRLNASLRAMPSWVLEAVVAHELAHAVHPDHSPRFWSLLRQVEPRTDRARAFLEGVSWMAARWRQLPELERDLLAADREEP